MVNSQYVSFIRIDKSTDFGVIISGLEIIVTGFIIIVIATIAKRICIGKFQTHCFALCICRIYCYQFSQSSYRYCAIRLPFAAYVNSRIFNYKNILPFFLFIVNEKLCYTEIVNNFHNFDVVSTNSAVFCKV